MKKGNSLINLYTDRWQMKGEEWHFVEILESVNLEMTYCDIKFMM